MRSKADDPRWFGQNLDPTTRRALETFLCVQVAGVSTAALLLKRWGAMAARGAVAVGAAIEATPDDAKPRDRTVRRAEALLEEHRRLARYATTLPRTGALIFLTEFARISQQPSVPLRSERSPADRKP